MRQSEKVESDFYQPVGLETCRPLIDRLYRELPANINLKKAERQALAKFGEAFDGNTLLELGKLAGQAGFSQADLNCLTSYLIFHRSKKQAS